MANSPQVSGNALLDRLPEDFLRRLLKKMQRIELDVKQVLYEARGRIEFAYFPINCVLSAVTLMQDGSAIEVATMGKEGAAGVPLFFGADTSPHRIFVQIAGDTLRIEASVLKDEAERSKTLQDLLSRYVGAFMAQVSGSVACNGLHPVEKRCCRWLLMTHDRIDSDEIALTHEFLAMMLGVRRASVSEVLQSLEEENLIRNGRGVIVVVDRKRLEAKVCECFENINGEYQRQLG
jgi:CRP-like cAMP-binding protein